MSLLMAEVEQSVAGSQDEFSASAGGDRIGEGRKTHPCFADSEFGNILRVLAEREAESED